MEEKGKLFLIPVTLGDISPLEVLPLSVKKVVGMVDHYIVENEKTARKFIKSIYPSKSQPSLQFSTINKFTEKSELPAFLQACLEGKNMGLMSEAGVPGIADPGADVIAIAHEKGIRVQPLVGPSSILMAMMSSGLNGQNFAFNGYLPIDKQERRKKIKELESSSIKNQQSQSFIETPYRNISLPTEFIKTLTADLWKKQIPELHKRPAIFIIQG
jgi:16S rRNA (cytidine1402-2'-O)-methyltransferase